MGNIQKSNSRGVLVACLVLSCAAGVAAVQKPNFTGAWIISPPNKAAGQEQLIKQDDKMLSITTGGRTMVHQLDGVEHRQTMSSRAGEIAIATRAVWENKTIVITTTTDYPNKMKTLAREVWSIDAQGQLVIDFTETAEGQPPRALKVIHTKKN